MGHPRRSPRDISRDDGEPPRSAALSGATASSRLDRKRSAKNQTAWYLIYAVLTMKTDIKRTTRFLFHAALCLPGVFPACTNGIMNVGEQPLPTDPATDTDTTSDQPHGTEALDAASASDVACGDGGVQYADHCWFLGSGGESCIEVCADRGGFDDATINIVGTPDQGGSWEACRDIIRLMGFDGEVGAGYRVEEEGGGVGCHLWDGELWWLYRPDLTPEARFSSASRICACLTDD